MIDQMEQSEPDILKQRAQLLARRQTLVKTETETIRVIEFILSPEHYAFDISNVKEVLTLRDLTPIPGTPGYVMGIVNFRGSILSVINLKVLFGIREKGLTELNKIIVLRNEQMEFGVLADAIAGTRILGRSELAPPPLTIGEADGVYISGTTAEGLILLDAGKMLASTNLVVNQK